MPFKKGQSGNPKGRPKKGDSYPEFIEKAVKNLRSVQKDKDGNVTARYKGKMVIAMAVAELATNKAYPPQIRLQAIKEIIDRTDGKAPQYLAMKTQIEQDGGGITLNFIDKEGSTFGCKKAD